MRCCQYVLNFNISGCKSSMHTMVSSENLLCSKLLYNTLKSLTYDCTAFVLNPWLWMLICNTLLLACYLELVGLICYYFTVLTMFIEILWCNINLQYWLYTFLLFWPVSQLIYAIDHVNRFSHMQVNVLVNDMSARWCHKPSPFHPPRVEAVDGMARL